ncbi:MAG: glycoside hydrolase family 9 protein [Paenibacillaceae bacterium]
MNNKWNNYPYPLPIDERHSAVHRWMNKPVIASRLLDQADDEAKWQLVEQGTMSFTEDRAKIGFRSVRLESPTTSSKIYQTEAPGRPHGKTSVKRLVSREDWSDYNRLSFWVYPTLPGFRVISMAVILHNDGAVKVPDGYLREGINYFLLKPDEWNQVVWEIDHLSRDQVTGVEFVYRLQGSDVGASAQVRYDISGIELQRVEADYVEGWMVAPGRIAYSHSGYATTTMKKAFASHLQATCFRIVHADTQSVVLEKATETTETPIGTFQLMDFSELQEEGTYQIQAGSLITESFGISDKTWESSIWKTINLFYCLRCGTEIPEIHGVCHRDFRCKHNDQHIVINGGWHDAGDLSQGLVNTAEAVYAMLKLAHTSEDRDELLASRLKVEARWGLDWILKTRFGDGYRAVWNTMDLWTDGIIGTIDDEISSASKNPFSNFTAASAEALAAIVLALDDPILSAHCLRIAEEDWQFAIDEWAMGPTYELHIETAAAGILAATQLYKSTTNESYMLRAVELSEFVMGCQQKINPDWDIPIRGFFYTTPGHDRILHYQHRGHEQAAIVALRELIDMFPSHPLWSSWYMTIVLHSEYMERIATYTQPYGMMPAGIYDLNESDESAYRDQVLSGIRLHDHYYLRLFPVWYDMRGNSGTVLSQTKAISVAAKLRKKLSLKHLSEQQLYWTVGCNPFGQSLMYGEGYDYTPQYTATSGNITGSLPVGIQTNVNRDVPYWPAQNCYNYKEVWVHPSSRWLWLMDDLYLQDGYGQNTSDAASHFTNKLTEHGDGYKLLLEMDHTSTEPLTLTLHMYNLTCSGISNSTMTIDFTDHYEVEVNVINPLEPWLFVVIPNGQLAHSKEIVGNLS